MTSLLVSVGLSVLLVGQVVATPTPASPEAIQQAVRELGADQFDARELASKFLWEQGLAADEALNAAAESNDPEVRFRARAILNDFRFGILPGVTAQTAKLLREFRDGDVTKRLQAFQQLAVDKQLETLPRLLPLETDPNARREMVQLVAQNPAAVDKFIELDKLPSLLDTVAADSDENWRRNVQATLLFSDTTLASLAKNDRLGTILKVLDDDRSGELRRRILSVLFRNPTTIASILEKQQLDFVLTLILKESDPGLRGLLLRQMMSRPEVVKHLAADGGLEHVLKLVGENTTADQRRAILQPIFASEPVVALLLEIRGLEGLLALPKQCDCDAATRGTLLGGLLGSASIYRQLQEKQQTKLAYTLAQDENDPAARSAYLRTLFDTNTFNYLLRDDETRLAFWKLVKENSQIKDNPDRSWQAGPVIRILQYSSSTAGELLRDEADTRWLMDLLQQSPDEKRGPLLDMLLASYPVPDLLIRRGGFDELLVLVRNSPRARRGQTLARLATLSETATQLAAAKRLPLLVSLGTDEPDVIIRYAYLVSLFQHQGTMDALMKAGFFDDFWTLTRSEKDPVQRATLCGLFLRTAAVVQEVIAREKLDTLFDFANEETNDQARQQYLLHLFGSTAAIQALLDRGDYDKLVALAGRETDEHARALLLMRLYVVPQAVDVLLARNEAGKLLEVAEAANPSEPFIFLQQVILNAKALSALLEQGKLPRLVALAKQSPSSRGYLLGSLYSNPMVVTRLAEQGQLDEVLQFLKDESPQSRQSTLNNFATTELIGALVEKNRLDELLTLARELPHPTIRAQVLARLLTHPASLERLAAEQRLDTIFETATKLDDDEAKQRFLQGAFVSSSAAVMLIEAGKLDELVRFYEGVNDEALRGHLLANLLANPKTYDLLAHDEHLNPLIEVCKSSNDPKVRGQFVFMLLYAPHGPRLLADPKLSRELADRIKAETNESTRQKNVRQLLSSRPLQQRLIDNGQAELIYELAKLVPDDGGRQLALRRMQFAPYGVAAYYLRQGESEPARKLLAEDARDDAGVLRLATYLLVAGGLDERIAELRRRIAETPLATDIRLLTWLLRAQGDLPAAREMAERTGDAGLIKTIAVEQADWPTAVRLQSAGPCPLPIPLPGQVDQDAAEPFKSRQRAERLGLLAAYQRLSEDEPALAKTVDELRQLVAGSAGDPATRWACTEALLLNNQPGDGMKLLAESYPLRAFDLYARQHRYRDALALVHWRADAPPDRAWLDSLPADADRNASGFLRVEFALRVAHTLQWLGEREAADQIIEVVTAYTSEQPADRNEAEIRRQCRELACAELLKMGRAEQAWEIGAGSLRSSDSSLSLYWRVDSARAREAEGWWRVLQLRNPGEPPADGLAHLYRILNPPAGADAAEFRQLVADAERLAQSQTDNWRDTMLSAVATTCLRRGEFELGERLLPRDTRYTAGTDMILADGARNRQQWPEAAERYQAVWQTDHEQLGALFLAGDALERAGRDEEGRKLKEQSSLQAIDSEARMQMAVVLASHGLRDEAIMQLEIVLRVAPPEHWQWNEAFRRICDYRHETAALENVELLDRTLIDDLRLDFYLLETRDYLRTPWNVHRLRAQVALKTHDFERVDREINAALAGLPGETRLAEELVPLLDEAGRAEQAETLFEKFIGDYDKNIADFPHCATLYNNVAWVSARCGRRLDQALAAAQRAVELEPRNAGFLDTLAEVYFQQGDRASAVLHSKQAVELDPNHAGLKRQLERFQTAALPSAS